MSYFSIACYRPKPGKDAMLLQAVREHYPVLKAEGLVTERLPYIMKAVDGSVIEVFEWKSIEAKELAHRNEAVGKLWQMFFACADFPPISELEEAKHPFSSFSALEIPSA